MIDLLAAIGCSACVSMVMRWSEGYVQDKTGMLAVNYMVCSLFALLCCSAIGFDAPSFACGALMGVLLVAGLILLQYNIHRHGVIVSSLYTSFFEWSGYDELSADYFVGLQNYIAVLTDSEFLAAIKNDFLIILGKEVIIVVLTVLFAVSLTRLRFHRVEAGIYRFVFFLPNVLSVVIIAIMWTFVLDPNFGILNPLLRAVGLERLIPVTGWTFEYPLGVITFVASWCGIGLFMLILITAINGISKELYESATIDGAGQIRTLWSIVMPQVKPAWMTLLVFSFQGVWNQTQANMVFSEELKLVNLAVKQIMAGGTARYGVAMAGSIVLIIPPILLFVFTQSQVMATMSHSGIKE